MGNKTFADELREITGRALHQHNKKLEIVLAKRLNEIKEMARAAASKRSYRIDVTLTSEDMPILEDLQTALYKLDLRTSWDGDNLILTVGWQDPTG